MASVDLENLTDSEIRAKFIELGHNIGPITSTTRKLYLKKLKSLLDGNVTSVDLNISTRNDSRNISHSSGEESDSGSSKTRRRSMPPPRTNKSPTRRKSPSRATLTNEIVANSTFVDTRSSSVKETFNTYSTSPTAQNIKIKRTARMSAGLNNSTRSQGIYGDDDESELDVSLSRPMLSQSNKENYEVTNNSPPKLTSPDLGVGLSDTFKSRLQASGSTSYSSSYNSPRVSSSSQPYVSDFVRKLSANRSVGGTSFNSSNISSKLLDVKESDDEDTGSSRVYTRFTQGGRSSPAIKGRGTQSTSYQDSWVPFDSPKSTVLLLLFSLFFVVIGVTYVNMHTVDTSLSSSSDIYFPLCSAVGDTGIPRVNCIRDSDKDITKKIFLLINFELNERLKSSPCSKIGDGTFGLSDSDIKSSIYEHDKTLSDWILDNQLPNVKILINANPKLNLAEISGGIAMLNPPLPFYCYIMNNVTLIAIWAAKIITVVLVIGGAYFGIRFWMKREASHKDEVYKLVSSIIEIVGARSQTPEGYVPIIHVRDQLISHQDRQRLDKLWNDAVDVINSDSRVRCEQQVVEGEDCLVWRWVASSYNSNKRKTWQGQAFDTMEGSVNSLPSSPTSCLKIRHMFDAALEQGDDWVSTVVDAILEKTGDARILHIAVERQSREGCVYMKCATPTDAGKAYRALHGSWFDSKLVTVKYIREARYLERFPESAKCTQPLYPSTQSHNSFK